MAEKKKNWKCKWNQICCPWSRKHFVLTPTPALSVSVCVCAHDASGRVWESNPARLQLADELGEPGLSHKERLQTKSRQHIDPGDAYHKKKDFFEPHMDAASRP